MKNGFYHRSLPQIQIYQRRWWLLSCFREERGLSYVSVPYHVYFPSMHFFQIEPYQSHIEAGTHTHEHPFTLIPVFLWSDTAADEKSKHSHSLKHTHGHAHVSFSTAPELLRGFQTACHVSHTLTVTSKCTLMAERTVYFFLNKWPHTHTHTAQFYEFSFHYFIFPHFVRLNRKQSSVPKVNGNQKLAWNTLISKNVNLSGWD